MSGRPGERRRLLVGVVVHTDVVALHGTLDALADGVRPGDRVVLVLDGPDPRTAAAMDADDRLRALLRIGSTQSLGGAAAFNRLVAERREDEDAVVLLENGARPAPDALDRLAAVLDEPGVGLAGPSTNDAWNEQRALPGGASDGDGLRSDAATLLRRHGAGHRSLAPLHSIAELCLVVSRETLAAIGGADEGFGAGPCWEMEYAARGARAGFAAAWVPAAYVHRHPPTTRRLQRDQHSLTAARHRYQDRLCGLRLSGARTDHAEHCDGDACPHFAPPDRIVLHLPVPPASGGDVDASAPGGGARQAPVPRRRATLVSCLLPTADRPAWLAQAVGYFRRQDHPARELVIVDDGAVDLRAELSDLLDDPAVVHIRLAGRTSIGAKRNLAAQHARGDVLVQWDDDDWYGPSRLTRQVAPIADGAADITALADACWFDVERWRFRRPSPTLHRRLFVEDVHGGTLAFHRSVWDRGARYPDTSLAEDAWFLRNALRKGARLARLPADGVYVYVRHGANSWQLDARYDGAGEWDVMPEPPELAGDRDFYATRSTRAPGQSPDGTPLVSGVMPTADRHRFVPEAVGAFLAQRGARSELVVVDDGDVPVDDLLPDDPRIRYVRLTERQVLGTKRNLAVEAARGEVIVHFDDDDWSHPDRLRVQLETLHAGDVDACGLARMLWWDPERGEAWRYACPPLRRPWVAGNTLAYRRDAWARSPFPPQALGEDTAFLWRLPTRRIVVIDDERLVIGRLHGDNTSPKHTRGGAWSPADPAQVRRVLAEIRAGSGADAGARVEGAVAWAS